MKKKELIIAKNRKAKFDYIISESIEVGIVLKGAEVKSIRKGTASLDNSYAIDKKGEFWAMNLHVDLKSSDKNQEKIDNLRPKKLLLKKNEMNKIINKTKQEGFTMIPLDLHYNKKGFIKILLGISKGRKKSDKREYKKEQDWKREKSRLERQ